MLKKFTLDEIDDIYEIYAYYVLNSTATFDIEVPDKQAFRDRMLSIAAKYPFIVYMQEGKVAGYAYASEFRSKDAFAKTAELTIYLDPRVQGKGIGSKLMESLIRELKHRRFITAVSVVTQPNDSSEYLHQKFGFTLTGTLPCAGFKFNQYLSIAFYYLDLREDIERKEIYRQ